jgi:hypothetical protein
MTKAKAGCIGIMPSSPVIVIIVSRHQHIISWAICFRGQAEYDLIGLFKPSWLIQQQQCPNAVS